jgi:hypothetical protein
LLGRTQPGVWLLADQGHTVAQRQGAWQLAGQEVARPEIAPQTASPRPSTEVHLLSAVTVSRMWSRGTAARNSHGNVGVMLRPAAGRVRNGE